MTNHETIHVRPAEEDSSLVIMALLERLRAEVENYRRKPHPIEETDWLDRLKAALGFITGHHGPLFAYLESTGTFLLSDPGNDAHLVGAAIGWMLEDERGDTPEVDVERCAEGVRFTVHGLTLKDGLIVPDTRVVSARVYAVVAQDVDLEVPADADEDAVAELVREQATWYHEVEEDDPADYPVEVLD